MLSPNLNFSFIFGCLFSITALLVAAQPNLTSINENPIPCPNAPADHQLKDLSKKAEDKVRSFFETISELGTNFKSDQVKNLYVKNTIKLFTSEGTVEERSKYRKTGIIKPVSDYLLSIKARGENTRLIISYEITDPLLPNDLICTEINNQLVLKGSMTIRQFYCRLNKYAKPSDNFDHDSQCEYWDITDKKINIEMKLMKTVNGYGWVVLINSIVVLNVQ